MHRICITTVVDKKYQHYIPLFVFCINHSYHKYHVRLFLSDDVDLDLDPIMRETGGRAEFIRGVFDGWKKHFYSPVAWRFVVPPEYYKDCEYVYITDIDMMIMWEAPGLLEFHLREMEQTGLCYSNSLRNFKHWKGRESLSGLHFCGKEWFEKTEESRQKYAKLLKSGEVGEKREYDGHMLYKMVKESGLKPPKKYKLVPRHHGIHLGNFRLFESNKSLAKRISKEKIGWWFEHYQNLYFERVVKIANENEMAKEQLQALDNFCRGNIG